MDDMTWSDIQRREDGRPPESLAFVPGVNFDPDDPDEVASVMLASERDLYSRNRHLEAENARLRALLDEREEY